MKNNRHFAAKYLADLMLWSSSIPLAYALQLTVPQIEHSLHSIIWVWLACLPLQALIILYHGLYRQSWHRVNVRDLNSVFKASGVFVLLFLFSGFLWRDSTPVPYSIPLISFMLIMLTSGLVRVLVRYSHEHGWHKIVRKSIDGAKEIIILGAGEAGIALARELFRYPGSGLIPIGFLDDDPAKRRQKFLGLPVYGKISDLPEIAQKLHFDKVLIAMPSVSGDVIRNIVKLVQKAEVDYQIVPALHDLLSGKVSINQIRNVDVEDLLRRKPVQLDIEEIAHYISGKTILVTGAGGSIGSEIVRQISGYKPGRVILLGRGEHSIFTFQQELKRDYPALINIPVITDIRDRNSLQNIFSRYRPQVVFHAGAHKHVPLMERNPEQAVKNNILGTKNLAELALEYRVERFVNISSDKAVNPTSVMGASKRVAEYLVHWASLQSRPNQVFVSVRFGNVLGSRGSVIPLFKDQIRRGGPITVTHPEMTRYFMTISEASQLVLQAGSMGENGTVYVLDMGEPVKIVDLAKDLIQLSGLEVGKDIEIRFSGIRPGEKLFEELLTAEEGTTATKHEKIFAAKNSGLPINHFMDKLEELFQTAEDGDSNHIRCLFKELIPTYKGKVEIKEAKNESVA